MTTSTWGQQDPQRPLQISYASVVEGAARLGERDEFIRRLSPFDRSARLKSKAPVDEAMLLAFIRDSVREWSDSERDRMERMVARAQARLRPFAAHLPPRIVFIKTSGQEEGGAAYTRGDAIIWPETRLTGSIDDLERLFYHELFHVISRRSPALRDACYAAIVFVPCDEITLPPELRDRQMTNPDGPRQDHCIQLQIDGRPRWGIPILLADTDRYAREQGGEFFRYLQFRWLLVERDAAAGRVQIINEDGRPALREMDQVERFYEQVGQNTGYIIHPDEILADNFQFVVMERADVPTPRITQALRAVLTDQKSVSRP